MIGLLMIFALATGLYYVWDGHRASRAEEKQLEANAERGGALFALNCRSCHGITGQGAIENPSFPGVPLNIDQYRPTNPGQLSALQQRLEDTIVCGRVGTLMPPWAEAQGGSLNDFQIQQLVTLITSSAASQTGWDAAIEGADHADDLGKHLIAAVGSEDTSFRLNDAQGLASDQMLRLNIDIHAGQYEVVKVVRAPSGTTLLEDLDAESNEVKVEGVQGIAAGAIIQIEDEKMRVIDASGDLLRVERAVEGTRAADHQRRLPVTELGDTIVVERGQFGTQAVAHEADTEVLNGPAVPPTGPFTGEVGTTPPCGQRAVEAPGAPGASPTPAAGSPTAAPTPSGSVEIAAVPVTRFDKSELIVPAGQEVTLVFDNREGGVLHNWALYKSATDTNKIAGTQLCTGPCDETIKFPAPAPGEYFFKCDVHPIQMTGKLTVR